MNVIVEIDATWLISIYPSHDANHLEALAQKDACMKSGPQCGMNALRKHQELSGEKRQESKLTQTKYIIIETAGEKMIWCTARASFVCDRCQKNTQFGFRDHPGHHGAVLEI